MISSLETVADHDQNRMGLVAYLMNSAQTQMAENKKKCKKEVWSIFVFCKLKPFNPLVSEVDFSIFEF